MTNCEFVPATHDLAAAYYGGPPKFTFRGYVALLEGEPVGVGGIFLYAGMPVAFSEMKPAMEPLRRDKVRAIGLMKSMLAEAKTDVYAVPGEYDTAPTVLKNLGFVPAGRSIEHGELWVKGG